MSALSPEEAADSDAFKRRGRAIAEAFRGVEGVSHSTSLWSTRNCPVVLRFTHEQALDLLGLLTGDDRKALAALVELSL